jgi:hypothetical protein
MHFNVGNNYEEISDELKLHFIKSQLNKAKDPAEKARLKTEYELLLSDIKTKNEHHVILLLHGMNTLASWQQTMKEELESYSNVKVLPLSYGYYGLFKFLSPKKNKQVPINKIKNDILIAYDRYQNSKFSLVAHSFGSFVISELLFSDASIANRVSNVILCGSIVNSSYAWHNHPRELLILNEVGSSDIWPVLAGHVSKEYGATGTFGFNGPVVNDRFHSIKHSDYFKLEFIKKYWVPFFVYGHIKPSGWGRAESKYPFLIEKAHILPTWLLVIIFVLVLVAFITLVISYTYISLVFFLILLFIYLIKYQNWVYF